ncbi:hypothetical protein T190_27020 [Sinorhizobium meliloti CCBAU 01290]|nr:hypothetical protein T190_27020 [Sinorhizobium meliloti CCBAU 01290]
MLKSIDRMYQTMLAELGQRALDGLVSTLTPKAEWLRRIECRGRY